MSLNLHVHVFCLVRVCFAIVEKAGGQMPNGDLVHIGGRKLRDHDGIHRFTIGQRRGIGVGTGEKLYVVDIDPESQKVVVGPQENLEVTKIKAEPAS